MNEMRHSLSKVGQKHRRGCEHTTRRTSNCIGRLLCFISNLQTTIAQMSHESKQDRLFSTHILWYLENTYNLHSGLDILLQQDNHPNTPSDTLYLALELSNIYWSFLQAFCHSYNEFYVEDILRHIIKQAVMTQNRKYLDFYAPYYSSWLSCPIKQLTLFELYLLNIKDFLSNLQQFPYVFHCNEVLCISLSLLFHSLESLWKKKAMSLSSSEYCVTHIELREMIRVPLQQFLLVFGSVSSVLLNY